MQNNIDSIKKQLKDNIQQLIDSGSLKEARQLIEQYKSIAREDAEAYSMDAVILITEGKLQEAEEVLKEGLNINPSFGDLYYNLAYIYKLTNIREKYLKNLTISYNRINNIDNKLLIRNEISKEYNVAGNDFKTKTYPIKVLIICSFYSIFSVKLILNLYRSYNIEFEVLTMDAKYLELCSTGVIKKVYKYDNIEQMKNCLKNMQKFDIVNIHFVSPFYSLFVTEIEKIACGLVCSFWGSDFYRISNKEKEKQEIILNKANVITFCNEEMGRKFNNYNKNKYIRNIKFVRFGLTTLNRIKYLKINNIDTNKIKDKLNIPKNKIIIACGYSANPIHNHIEIINNLIKLDDDLLNKLFFIFPMTYGNKDYCDKLELILEKTRLNYKIFSSYMSDEEIAEVRIITQIMIHVPISDQLSGTMQEILYNGGIVISGTWLPYRILKENGIKYLEVNDIKEINEKIFYAINNLDELAIQNKSNCSKIWELSSWDKNTRRWFNIYDELIKKVIN